MSIKHRKSNPLKVYGQYDENPKVTTSVKLTAENSSYEARTNQSFKKSCDINNILARFQKTGVLEHVSKYEPQYGELSVIDFETAFNTVKQTEEMFDALPANVRATFHNKPENFLAYMEEEKNRNLEGLLTTSDSRDGTANAETEVSGEETSGTEKSA